MTWVLSLKKRGPLGHSSKEAARGGTATCSPGTDPRDPLLSKLLQQAPHVPAPPVTGKNLSLKKERMGSQGGCGEVLGGKDVFVRPKKLLKRKAVRG